MAVFVPFESSRRPYGYGGYGRCHAMRPRQNPFNDIFGSILSDTLNAWPVILAQTQQQEKPKHWYKELTVRGFKPDEIKVEEKDGFVKIHARHEERDLDDFDLTEVVRNVKLPAYVDPSSIKISYKCGRLVLKGIRKEAKENDTTVPISKLPSDSHKVSTVVEEKNEDVVPSESHPMEDKANNDAETPEAVDDEDDHNEDKEDTTQLVEKPIQTSVVEFEPYKATFQLSDFEPDDISVRTEGRHLVVKAEKREDKDGVMSYQVLQRRTLLPENVKVDEMKSVLAEGGELTVVAPTVASQDQDQTIPIVTE